MKKRKIRLRSKLLDFLVILICLAACYYSLKLFWQELNAFTTRTDITEIAEIQYKYKVAQRKFSDRVVWERVQQHSPIYNADTIRTADGALATISFNNKEKTVIELSESTMIQVFVTEDGDISVSLGSGAIDVQTGQSDTGVRLLLSNGSSVMVKSGTHVSADSKSSSSDSFVVVYNGQASLVSTNGEEVLVTEGQTVRQNASGNSSMIPVTVTSIPAKTNVLSFDKEEVPVNYSFSVIPEYADEKIIIEISETPDFSEIKETYVSENAQTVTVPSSSKFYWRAYPESVSQEEKENSANGTVNIISVSEVILLSPSASSKISMTKQRNAINFRWQGNEYVSQYKMEVARDSNFTNIVYTAETPSSNMRVEDLKEGEYFWRVTPYYAIQNVGYKTQTNYSLFTVVMEDEFTSPLLSYPVNNTVINTSVADSSINFVWKSNVPDAAFKLLVSKDRDFSSFDFVENTEFNRFSKTVNTKTMADGTYYWKVVRNSPTEKHASESNVGSFIVKYQAPQKTHLVYPPENYTVEKDRVYKTQFAWVISSEYNDTDVTSIFQISRSKSFNDNVFEISTKKTDAQNVKLTEGSYYWRIGVKPEGVSAPLEYSDIQKINVGGVLSAPEVIWPPKDGVVILPGTRELNITWKPVNEAQYYKAKIIDPKTQKVLYEGEAVTSTKNTLKIPLDYSVHTQPEPLLCTVQAFVDSSELSDYRVGEKAEVNFNLRTPLPVTLLTPAAGQRIDGKTALTRDLVFTWRNGDRADKTQFILRKVQSDGSTVNIKTVNNPSKQVKISNLATGTYEWAIKASSNEGYVMDSGYRRFMIGIVPLLATPYLKNPGNGFVIDTEYLRNNREISFEWNAVPDATEYSFILYLKDKDGKLKKVFSKDRLKDTQVTFKDLKLLDIGEFEWHVTAYNTEGGRRAIQSSKEGVSKFVIDIPLPDKVKTKDPGKMYGE